VRTLRPFLAGLFGTLTILVSAAARADDMSSRYDSIYERPDVYGDMVMGWRLVRSSTAGSGEARPDAWGGLFGMATHLYTGPKEKVSGRATMELAGGGGHYGEYRAVLDWTMGKRADLGDSTGIVLRAGFHAHGLGSVASDDASKNDHALMSSARVDLPTIELAFQRTHGIGLFELGVRDGFTLVGKVTIDDESRTLGFGHALTAYMAYHHDDFHLELEGTRASIGKDPANFATAYVCSTAGFLGLCADVRYTDAIFERPDGSKHLAGGWSLGATLGVGFDWANMK
jgi:hypothetical protein